MGWASGKHALITGGGSGIGAATARMLAAEGAKLSLLGRRREPLDAVAGETGGTAIPCDITDRAATEAAYAAARAANGPLDYVILNAGIADSAPFARTSRESFDRIIATNLTAAFDGAQLALPDLIAGRGQEADFRRLGRGTSRRRLCRALCRLEAWRDRADEKPGARICFVAADRQRGLPGLCRHRR